MIDILKTKIAVVDFDNTLCIHTRHGDWDRVYTETLLKDEYIWDTARINGELVCKPSPVMKKFVDFLKSNHVIMGVCSSVSICVNAEMKCRWASDNYDYVFRNWSVGSSEPKVNMLKHLKNAYGINPFNILFIDDSFENLDAAGRFGCQTASPLEIADFVMNGLK